jgi:transposase InsO family protein
VVDASNRTVVGWAMVDRLRTELVLDAVAVASTGRGHGRGAGYPLLYTRCGSISTAVRRCSAMTRS